MSSDGTERWVFECQGCGETWVEPPAPCTGHYCDWNGRGMPPEGMEPADVEVIEKRGGGSA
jgi:hypothetical protein